MAKKEFTTFLKYSKGPYGFVAIMHGGAEKFKMSKGDLIIRLKNLKRNGDPYEETEKALAGFPGHRSDNV